VNSSFLLIFNKILFYLAWSKNSWFWFQLRVRCLYWKQRLYSVYIKWSGNTVAEEDSFFFDFLKIVKKLKNKFFKKGYLPKMFVQIGWMDYEWVNVHPIIKVSLNTSLKSTALFRKLHKRASRNPLITLRFTENLSFFVCQSRIQVYYKKKCRLLFDTASSTCWIW
jgi:hypothetical protein